MLLSSRVPRPISTLSQTNSNHIIKEAIPSKDDLQLRVILLEGDIVDGSGGGFFRLIRGKAFKIVLSDEERNGLFHLLEIQSFVWHIPNKVPLENRRVICRPERIDIGLLCGIKSRVKIAGTKRNVLNRDIFR